MVFRMIAGSSPQTGRKTSTLRLSMYAPAWSTSWWLSQVTRGRYVWSTTMYTDHGTITTSVMRNGYQTGDRVNTAQIPYTDPHDSRNSSSANTRSGALPRYW